MLYKVEGARARLKRLLCDSMGDLCSRRDAMNNMLILQHTKLNASFQKNNNVVDHMFNTHFTRTYMALY